jgi:2-isopropylmalate synthase
VRILNPDEATGAITRVTIEASDGTDSWFTVGCSSNIIDASYQALADSCELYLLRKMKLNVVQALAPLTKARGRN